jgi:hypothetical protein
MVTLDERSMRLAGLSAIGAVAALMISGAAVLVFFNGGDVIYGTINDVFVAITLVCLVAITLVCLVLPVLAIRSIIGDEVGRWFDVLTWAALAGFTVASIGQILLVVRAIDLQTAFVTGGVGILPSVVWAIAGSNLSARSSRLPHRIGWLLGSMLILALVETIVASLDSTAATLGVSVALLLSMVGWLLSVAAELQRRGGGYRVASVTA